MFSSKYNKINLGKDIDKIVNEYLDQLNKTICDCSYCLSFRGIFKVYERLPKK
jgi:hypothetical protein